MLQTHVNNDIYNKYCLIHNSHFTELLKFDTAVIKCCTVYMLLLLSLSLSLLTFSLFLSLCFIERMFPIYLLRIEMIFLLVFLASETEINIFMRGQCNTKSLNKTESPSFVLLYVRCFKENF